MKIKFDEEIVETLINTLNKSEVDGETMEFILKQVGMEEQMLRQLFLKSDNATLFGLALEKKNV